MNSIGKYNYKYIQDMNRRKVLALNPDIKDKPGIYFITRVDEEGNKHAYIGQAGGIRKKNGEEIKVKQGVLTRLAQHLSGTKQHIDLSIRSHGLYSDDNLTGYKMNALYFEPEELNDKEQYYINKYLKNDYILKNKTSGSQDFGKKKIAEYKKHKRSYSDGVETGYIKASKEIAHLFDLHLDVSTKKEPPTKNQQKALDKFNDFLDYHKKEKEK